MRNILNALINIYKCVIFAIQNSKNQNLCVWSVVTIADKIIPLKLCKIFLEIKNSVPSGGGIQPFGHATETNISYGNAIKVA